MTLGTVVDSTAKKRNISHRGWARCRDRFFPCSTCPRGTSPCSSRRGCPSRGWARGEWPRPRTAAVSASISTAAVSRGPRCGCWLVWLALWREIKRDATGEESEIGWNEIFIVMTTAIWIEGNQFVDRYSHNLLRNRPLLSTHERPRGNINRRVKRIFRHLLRKLLRQKREKDVDKNSSRRC